MEWTPKFKVGDRLRHIYSGRIMTVERIRTKDILNWLGYHMKEDITGLYLEEALEPA